MNFPAGPINGQTTTINGIVYVYDSTKTAWKRSVSPLGNLTVLGNITASNITVTSNAAANKFYVTDGIYWAGNGVAFASSTYSNANVAEYLLTGAVIGAGSSNVVIGATTQSESVSTGALVVRGGAGIAGNLYVGGNLVVSNVSYEYREVITTTETVQGNIVAASGTASTNTTTGALVVVGGAGIGGALFITNTGDVSANIGSLIANAATQQTQINNIITNANANVAAYLPTYTGNIGAGNIITTGTSGNISGVNYILASNYVYPNGVSILTGISGTYSNTNVEAYFGANIGSLLVNAATQATSINTINANLGAYQIYANANIGSLLVNAATQATSINTINANLGAYQIYANANIGSIYNQLNTLDANVGAFEIYANANIGSIYNQLNTLDANVGAFEIYANANIGTLFLGNVSTNANLGAFQIYANTTFTTYSNANVTAYLPTHTGNIAAGNIAATSNISADSFFTTSGIYWSGNGAAYAAGGGGGGSGTPGGDNTQIQFNDSGSFNGANITFDKSNGNLVISSVTDSTSATTGALTVGGGVGIAGNVYSDKFYTANGIFWAANGSAFNGISFYASSTVPTSVSTGTLWYKTTTDVLYEYINDGITDYWIDISSQTIAANTSGVSTFAGTVFGANITFTGSITGTVGYLIERANVVASAPPAVTNLDLITAPILYFTSNTTQNITANIRGNSTVSLNSLLSIGQSTTFVIFVPNATAYYVNTIKVDNTTVTPFWQGGLTVSGGNANSIDIYTFAVLKTANATFKVFASQVKYQNLGP